MSRCCRTARPASSRSSTTWSPWCDNRWGVAAVERATKGNYSAPAEPELVQQLARRRLVITGVGD